VRRKTLGLLSLPLLLACSSPEERAEQARSEVVEALQRGERGEALEALERLRAIKPDTPHALGQYAALLVRTGEAPQAIWELEAGIARFPESHELRLLLGGVALLVSDPARARSVVEAIPAGSEHHARALVLRARAEIELGDLERGLATLEEAERHHPDAHELRLPRIAALLRDRRHDEAREALDAVRALAEDEQDQAVLRNLELALYTAQAADAGGAEAAIAGLRAMLQSRPEDAQAWVALIQVLVRERRAAEALELASAALEDDPDLYGLYGQLARLQASAGRFDDARATLRRFVEKSGSASAYLALAQFSIQQEDADGALAAFEEGLTAHSDDPLLLAGLAEALIGFDRLASARSTLARYRELTPDAPTVEYLRARLELAEGQEDAAIERLRRLLPTRDDVATQYWLGRALEAAGDEDGALKHYQQAVLRNPNDASPYLSLIAMGERRGDWRLVVFYAQRFLLRAPGRARVWDALILALVQGGELEDAEERARQPWCCARGGDPQRPWRRWPPRVGPTPRPCWRSARSRSRPAASRNGASPSCGPPSGPERTRQCSTTRSPACSSRSARPKKLRGRSTGPWSSTPKICGPCAAAPSSRPPRGAWRGRAATARPTSRSAPTMRTSTSCWARYTTRRGGRSWPSPPTGARRSSTTAPTRPATTSPRCCPSGATSTARSRSRSRPTGSPPTIPT
jgi:predicted Zn-dependent protease